MRPQVWVKPSLRMTRACKHSEVISPSSMATVAQIRDLLTGTKVLSHSACAVLCASSQEAVASTLWYHTSYIVVISHHPPFLSHRNNCKAIEFFKHPHSRFQDLQLQRYATSLWQIGY